MAPKKAKNSLKNEMSSQSVQDRRKSSKEQLAIYRMSIILELGEASWMALSDAEKVELLKKKIRQSASEENDVAQSQQEEQSLEKMENVQNEETEVSVPEARAVKRMETSIQRKNSTSQKKKRTS